MQDVDWKTIEAKVSDVHSHGRLHYKLCCFTKFKVNKDLILSFKKTSIFNSLLVLESIKRSTIIGSGLPNWKSYMNNALDRYGQNWPYFKKAFVEYWSRHKYQSLFNTASVHRKIFKIESQNQSYSQELDRFVRILYPELATES